MIYGLDEYYVGLINEAKTPEEIKKILEYQFVQGKGVPEEVLNAIFEIDPTKKKSYTRWVLMQWDNYKDGIVKTLKDGRLAKLFQTFKERSANGLDLSNVENFEKALEFLPEVDPILEKSNDPNDPANKFDIVFRSSEWIIAVPHTYEADKKLGEGCRWCTAGAFGDNDYYWKHYSNEGPLWINFDLRSHQVSPLNHKEYPYTRYQFLFEHNNFHGELMDINDRRINFGVMNVPQDVLKFYKEQNEKYYYTLTGLKSPEEERMMQLRNAFNQARIEDSVVLSQTPPIRIMPTTARTEDWQLPPENERVYCVYGNDLADPLFPYLTVRKDTELKKLTETGDIYSITGNDGKVLVFEMSERGYVMHTYHDVYKRIDFDGKIILFDREIEYWGGGDDEFDEGTEYNYSIIIDPRQRNRSHYPAIQVNMENTFFNEQVSKAFGKICYERVEPMENDLHALDILNGTYFYSAIRYDYPLNGESFEADENGMVHGKILTYNLRSDTNYQIERSIEYTKNKFYLVFYGTPEDVIEDCRVNIADPRKGELLLKEDALFIDEYQYGVQVIAGGESEASYAFCADLGKQLTPTYNHITNVENNTQRNNCFYLFAGDEEDWQDFTNAKTHDLIRISEGPNVEIFHNMVFDESWWGYFVLLSEKGELCIMPSNKEKEIKNLGVKPVAVLKDYSLTYSPAKIHYFDNEWLYTINPSQYRKEDNSVGYRIEIERKSLNDIDLDTILATRRMKIVYTNTVQLKEIKSKFNNILERINKPLRGEIYG